MKIVSLVADRKVLVSAIGEIIGEKMKYQGPPTFQYVLGAFTVERDGTLTVDSPEMHRDVLDALVAQKIIDDEWSREEMEICIDFSLNQHSAQSLTNLMTMVWSKQQLINKAVGSCSGFQLSERFIEKLVEEPPADVSEFLLLWEKCGGEDATKGITFIDEKVRFSGFPYSDSHDWVHSYMSLASKISQLAIASKRIKAEQTKVDNEKYAFRVWLVRLGFDGIEHKQDRKLLLSNLRGHAAFRTEEQKVLHKMKYQNRGNNAES